MTTDDRPELAAAQHSMYRNLRRMFFLLITMIAMGVLGLTVLVYVNFALFVANAVAVEHTRRQINRDA